MRAYIIRRLLLMIPTILGVTIITFFLVRFMPGDIIDAILATSPDDFALDRAALERAYGLDASLIVQYGRWMGFVPNAAGKLSGILQGDLGVSWWHRVPVAELIRGKWPVTIELGVLAILIAQLIALPIGILSALRQDTWGDYIGRTFAIIGISIPGFWLGTMVIVLPAIWWGYMPPLMLIRLSEDLIGNLKMFLAPAIVLGLALMGVTTRMARTMMLEVLRQDYIRTAWAKGLRERIVVARHALKNAFIPIVTVVGLQLPLLIGGTVIIEQIFNLPGMGRLIVTGTFQRDQPVVFGTMLFFALALMLINLLIDLAYAYLDPRIHYGNAGKRS
jgi:peptide/nickel transport system permease protein